jgi:hypothetical protein
MPVGEESPEADLPPDLEVGVDSSANDEDASTPDSTEAATSPEPSGTDEAESKT